MDTLRIKAKLLAIANIELSKSIYEYAEIKSTGNLLRNEWLFLKLNQTSRVRLTVSDYSNIVLCKNDKNGIFIYDKTDKDILIDNLEIETPLAHAPEQMFFSLYRKCIRGCKFCPLTYKNENKHHSLDDIFGRIKSDGIPKSIGITSSNPPNLSTRDIADELCFITSKVRHLLGDSVPIGVSMNSPSYYDLKNLKLAGVNEVRLNIETPNEDLSKMIMPKKTLTDIYKSIEMACNIFGRGKVSSNIIIGLGETDTDIINSVEHLAEMGAVATLYPYDTISPNVKTLDFTRPPETRIYNLALIHKEILQKHKLNPLELKTMCCECAASHIFPGKDL